MDVETLELEVKEDRISDLPDSIIQRIISLLPSTREAIHTTLLSKRWHNQWTRVPVLIFDSDDMPSHQDDDEYLLRLIDNALHLYDCSNIKKLQLGYDFQEDPGFASKLRFATRKHVEELILNYYFPDDDCYMLPKFLIHNSSLLELTMYNCSFADWSINWGSLKKLEITGLTSPSRPSIGKLISGCPMLESLELENSDERGLNTYDDVIASKTLKRLILSNIEISYQMKISCPNLVELVIMRVSLFGFHDEMIEISCPNLKSVELDGLNFKLVNCPSLVYAVLDFVIDTVFEEDGENVAKKNLEQLQNVTKLTVSSWFTKALSALEMEGLSYPMLNNKSLALCGFDFKHLPGIACALRSSPMLERLNIRLPSYVVRMAADLSDLNDSGENYWNSIGTDINFLVSHLRYVEICGFFKLDNKGKLVINFIEFLLKNARVLEKLVMAFDIERTTDFGPLIGKLVSGCPLLESLLEEAVNGGCVSFGGAWSVFSSDEHQVLDSQSTWSVCEKLFSNCISAS